MDDEMTPGSETAEETPTTPPEETPAAPTEETPADSPVEDEAGATV